MELLSGELLYDAETELRLAPDQTPFTGAAYTFRDGQLAEADTYRDGIAWGAQRAWHWTGAATFAVYLVADIGHGLSRRWHRNGRLDRAEVLWYGGATRWRTWAEDGQPLEDGRPGEGAEAPRVPASCREACDREVLPDEFRPDLIDWSAPPAVQPLPPPGHSFTPPSSAVQPPTAPGSDGAASVRAEELGSTEDAGPDRRTYRGQWFTGLALKRHRNGAPAEEAHYRDGFLWGPRRLWYETGRPALEGYYFAGDAHGAMRRWHPNGEIAVLAEVRCGVGLRRRTWYPDGRGLLDERFPDTDWRHAAVRRRAEYLVHTVGFQPVPAEFLPPEEWFA
jgi:antitoxin component YwqK of YwqJK toxin-antitoxin module